MTCMQKTLILLRDKRFGYIRHGLTRDYPRNYFIIITGPYRVVEKLNPIHYRLRTCRNKPVSSIVHANRMKHLVDPDDRPIEPPVPRGLRKEIYPMIVSSMHQRLYYRRPLQMVPLRTKMLSRRL